ncbi:MAG: methyl-accepting chemotaxis protein [Myxococcota bacterium]|nr:methyl-accepting chemotaxis protein [Myxococcota bacterium]
MDALDRVTHYFDVTRFWSADLTHSAERVSKQLAHPAFEELANTGSISLAKTSWQALENELDLLAEHDPDDARFIREAATKMKEQLELARAAFDAGDLSGASVANATARSAIAATHMRLREATVRYAERAARLGSEIQENIAANRQGTAVGGGLCALLVLLLSRVRMVAAPVNEQTSNVATTAAREPAVIEPAPAPQTRAQLPRTEPAAAQTQPPRTRVEPDTPAARPTPTAKMPSITATDTKVTERVRSAERSCEVLATHVEQLASAVAQPVPRAAEEADPTSQASPVQLTQRLDDVTRDADAVTQAVSEVEDAVEAIHASVDTVSQHSDNASSVATRANEIAERTDDTITSLGQSAREIGTVVQLISDIAKRTNLLALNATIQAASAGEAGRGFAVVADEVKELARQTADATKNISANVKAMQKTTQSAVDAIGEITSIIEEVSGIATAIRGDVSTQRGSTAGVRETLNTAIGAAREIQRGMVDARSIADQAAGSTEDANSKEAAAYRSATDAARSDLEASLDTLTRELAGVRSALDEATAQGNAAASWPDYSIFAGTASGCATFCRARPIVPQPSRSIAPCTTRERPSTDSALRSRMWPRCENARSTQPSSPARNEARRSASPKAAPALFARSALQSPYSWIWRRYIAPGTSPPSSARTVNASPAGRNSTRPVSALPFES